MANRWKTRTRAHTSASHTPIRSPHTTRSYSATSLTQHPNAHSAPLSHIETPRTHTSATYHNLCTDAQFPHRIVASRSHSTVLHNNCVYLRTTRATERAQCSCTVQATHCSSTTWPQRSAAVHTSTYPQYVYTEFALLLLLV